MFNYLIRVYARIVKQITLDDDDGAEIKNKQRGRIVHREV